MELNRREVCSLLPALLSSSWFAAGAGLASATFPFDGLEARKRDFGESRPIVKGTTQTGEQVEVHETMLNAGAMPHSAHRHKHSEFWLIREGTVELSLNGQRQRLGPGSAAFASSNDEHGIKNIGTGPAWYFVVAIGPMN